MTSKSEEAVREVYIFQLNLMTMATADADIILYDFDAEDFVLLKIEVNHGSGLIIWC